MKLTLCYITDWPWENYKNFNRTKFWQSINRPLRECSNKILFKIETFSFKENVIENATNKFQLLCPGANESIQCTH